ncbi:MAG: sulfite exporter TauE/SafE family protein [Pseudomonadota bacterium]
MLAFVGVASGWINVVAGGGSLLSLPAMVFMGLPGPAANGTNRIAIIAQSVSAVMGFFSRGFSDFRLSATLAIVASIGAYFGAKVGVALDGAWFDRTLAVIIVGVVATMLTGADNPAPVEQNTGRGKNLVLGHVLMLGAGFWGGFIQVALGLIVMPILNRVMGIDLVRTNMHKVTIALVLSIVSLSVFAANVDIAWKAGLALAVGNGIGGWLGANSTVSHGAPLIKKTLIVVLIMMAVKLVFF